MRPSALAQPSPPSATGVPVKPSTLNTRQSDTQRRSANGLIAEGRAAICVTYNRQHQVTLWHRLARRLQIMGVGTWHPCLGEITVSADNRRAGNTARRWRSGERGLTARSGAERRATAASSACRQGCKRIQDGSRRRVMNSCREVARIDSRSILVRFTIDELQANCVTKTTYRTGSGGTGAWFGPAKRPSPWSYQSQNVGGAAEIRNRRRQSQGWAAHERLANPPMHAFQCQPSSQ